MGIARLPGALIAVLFSLAPIAACSSKSAGSGPADSGGGGDGSQGGGDAAVETGAGGDSGEAGTADAGPVDTSSACGAIPVLGSQSPQVSAACVTCVDAQCCTQATTCAADAACLALRTCDAACANSTCTAACATAHTAGQTDSSAFATCRQTSCNAPCQSFACIGSVSWPTPVSPTYTFKLSLSDFQTGSAVTGATVKVCATTDAACASPSAMYTVDSTGSAMVTAPSAPGGLAGYIEISGTGIEPTLDFFAFPDPAAVFGSATGINAYILSTSTFAQLTGAAGITPDPTRGTLAFIADDCAGNSAAGVSVTASTSDASSTTTYVVGGIPSTTATATDPSGVGAIVNVPAGAATMSGKTSAGTKTGSQAILFRAGAVTSTNVVPTP
jgi:hypothetical protein